MFASFSETLGRIGIHEFRPNRITTLQLNIGKTCNQACQHCHVDAGPQRVETMSAETARTAVRVLQDHPQLQTVDITGGAPEVHAQFRYLVTAARELGRVVIDRCNLTVLLDENQHDLAEFLARHRVIVTASLPCYLEQNVDQQRGRGAYQKSITALKLLNSLGYGREGSSLELNLVYNPVGPSLPPPQAQLEADYKAQLQERFGIVFNRLLTITNMPISRFREDLVRRRELDAYMQKLSAAFNGSAVEHLMCRDLISVGWDGTLYDCDFNQMLDMRIEERIGHISRFNLRELETRRIQTGDHCFGCTAGAGSSLLRRIACSLSMMPLAGTRSGRKPGRILASARRFERILMRFAASLAVLLAFAFSAAAADGDEAPLALNGACPVCLIDGGRVSQGSPDISQVYKGYTYRFPKQKVKDKFNSNPDRYAIQLDGYSPVSRADGKDEKGDPSIYSVYNHRVYIFKDANQKAEFERHPDEYVEERRAARPAQNTGG